MIPKVSSLPSLNQAASARGVGRANSQAGGRDNNSGSRRRSIDSNSRSRSRHGSNVDLVALELDTNSGASAAIAIPQRAGTPPPLWTANLALEPLLESPATFSAADALAHMSKLSAALAESRSIDEPWAGLAVSPSTYALPVAVSPASSPVADCVASLDISKEPVKSSLIVEPVQVVPAPAVTAPAPAAPPRPTSKSGKKRVGPAARPGPDELRIYRTTMKMDYVQELLGNIAHVQHMVRGVAASPSTTGAAAAIAAAKLLARSLSRSAVRMKESVKDPNTVHLSEDALVTLAEFGWVEVSTEDPEQAKLIGCVEAELHHIPSGRVTAWQRPAVDKSWSKVGESLAMEPYYWDRATAVGAVAGSASAMGAGAGAGVAADGLEKPAAGQLGVAGPAVAAVAAAARRGLMPLAGLADQLVAAGQSVMAAAAALQMWLEEQKGSLATAVSGGDLAASTPTNTPAQPLNTVVGFCPPSLAVAVGI